MSSCRRSTASGTARGKRSGVGRRDRQRRRRARVRRRTRRGNNVGRVFQRYPRARWAPQGARGGRSMIANTHEYVTAQEELRLLEERLRRVQQGHPAGSKGFNKAGIRKMIARLDEELAVYEGSEEARRPESDNGRADPAE